MEFIVTGKDVYKEFLHEAGGHRFQRIPPTEKRGRRQTSTVTVAVLQLKEKSNYKLNYNELKFEAKRGTGAGGQHKNVTESAIKVTHIPTGITAECQDERSQHRNKKTALEILSARLEKREKLQKQSKENNQRKNQIGMGQRGDKIRTYRFQDDRAIDHRTGKKIRLEDVLMGRLDLFRK